MLRAWSSRLRPYCARRCYLLGGSDSTRPAGTMSGDGYLVRRGAGNPPLTYRLFDNVAHGLEPEFRLLDLADMKG